MPTSREIVTDYLNRRGDHVTLISPSELTAAELDSIPEWFLDVAGVEGPAAVTAATEYWDRMLPGLLTDAIALFRERAVAVFLGRAPRTWGGQIVLVYVLRGEDDPFSCWVGYPPTDRLEKATRSAVPEGMRADPSLLPIELRTFYTKLHNRFELATWGACGLPPVNDMFHLDWSADEWEYESATGRRPDPNHLVVIFIRSGGSLCVERGTDDSWLQTDSTLEPVGKLWPTLNAWIRRETEYRN